MIQRLRKDQKGFTLIELMIVIAIIGILSAIAIPNFLSYRRDSANGAAKAELKSFYNACVAAASAATADTTWDTSSLPTGFSPSAAVTIGGSIVYTAATGTIASTATATHNKGDTTFSVDAAGVITP